MDLNELYSYFNEEDRLKSKSSSIEFLTTNHYIRKFLKPNMKILDIGAGTGAYSFYYAKQGYEVTAIDLVEKHVEIMKSKVTSDMKIKVYQGNALDLSFLEDGCFDLVLCLGPLYHFDNDFDKLKCINEAKRLCKKGGIIFFAYISNDMVFVTESTLYNPKFLKSDHYDKNTFKIKDITFCFLTVEKMEDLMKKTKLKKLHQFAADGLAELLEDKINKFNDDEFNEWFRYHLYACEKENVIGYSNHIVYVAKK